MLKKLRQKEYKKKLSLYISIKIYLTIFLTIFTFVPIPVVSTILFCGYLAFGNASFLIFISKALLDKPYENASVKYIFLLIAFLWIVLKLFSSKKKSDKIVTFGIISLEFAEILSLVYIYIYSYISSQTVPFTAWDITAVIVGSVFRLACIAFIIIMYRKSHRNPQKEISGQGLAENPAETQLPDTPADKIDS